jgi:hypothetical protein
MRRPPSSLHPPFVRLGVNAVIPHWVGPQTRLRTAMEGHYSSTPGVLARVRVIVSRSVITYSTPSVPLVGTPRFHRKAAYTLIRDAFAVRERLAYPQPSWCECNQSPQATTTNHPGLAGGPRPAGRRTRMLDGAGRMLDVPACATAESEFVVSFSRDLEPRRRVTSARWCLLHGQVIFRGKYRADIGTIIPKTAAGHKAPILISRKKAKRIMCTQPSARVAG